MQAEPDHIALYYRFGAALLIGLLVGLQREYSQLQQKEYEKMFGGVRTYALLGLLGCTAAFVAERTGSVLAFVVIIGIGGGLVMIAYAVTALRGSIGMTSEAAAVITMLTGALCFWGELELAAALGVSMAVVLALKLQTQTLVRNITPADVYATLTFAVIALVILPVLPRTSFGPPPFDVLVPYKIWLMVIFISGISFLGYVFIKIVGARRGVGLTGLLGGLASSTAVTLSFAQRSRDLPGLARPFALAILLAWSIMFVRVMVEVAALNQPLLRIVWIPLTAALVVSMAYCVYLYYSQSANKQEEEDHFKNPFELGPALSFGLLYAAILLAANAARLYLGDTGVYLSSIVSGLADVDAITLSMAELSRAGGAIEQSTAARAIVLAVVSNTLVKGGIVVSMGSAALVRAILPGILATLATAVGVVFLL
ncbi:MAG TPA: MgtC/SapB family protein [Gammaproteobacteria bacterium]|nr:MgtC/SapB family protein [Gammaproteobacteria bacterium]